VAAFGLFRGVPTGGPGGATNPPSATGQGTVAPGTLEDVTQAGVRLVERFTVAEGARNLTVTIEALKELERWFRDHPDSEIQNAATGAAVTFSEAKNSLAWYIGCNRAANKAEKEYARSLAEEALRVASPDAKANALDTLAVVAARSDDWDTAIASLEAALADGKVSAAEKAAYQRRLDLFRRHQPWDDPW
jgi:hypothetical protein